MDTLIGVLTAIVKQLCLDRWGAPTSTASSLLFTVHSCLSKSSTCISNAHAREIWVGWQRRVLVATVLSLWCCAHFSHMVVTFRGRRKGNLVFSWSKVAVRLANANPSEVLQVLLGITLLLFNQAKLFYGRFAKLFPASNRCSLTDKLWANACSQGISRNMSIACNALVDGNLNRHALSVGINTAINMLKRNDMSPSPFRLLEHMVDFLPPPLEGSPGVHKSGRVLKQVTSG